jgi:hypothetical protein
VMCLNTVSVDWMGNLYDCDFNQMLEIPLSGGHINDRGAKSDYHLTDLLTSDLNGFPIKVAEHCYGCAAGQGSSCGGAID